MPQLVFVPLIGFRPPGTGVLREPVETTSDGTRLIVLAVAAAPGRTDIVVEWERLGDPATCPPGSQLLTYSNFSPMDKGVTASLLTEAGQREATTMKRRTLQAGHPSIGAIDVITFPELPHNTERAELRITDGGTEWRVPLALVPGELNASALNVELEHGDIVARATGVARHDDDIVVAVEIAAPQQIRQVGAPVPPVLRLSSTSVEDYHERLREHRRVFGERSRSITLEIENGTRVEEVGRLFSFEPQQSASGDPYVNRFVVAFHAPSTGAKLATLVIPFIELNDFAPSATADLRDVPLDVALAEHRFRVVAVEPYGADQRKITIELAPSTTAPRFVQPARLHGSDPQFGWERHAVDAKRAGSDAIWMATKVGDPPIVTFTGAVMRVDGPLRLELPLV